MVKPFWVQFCLFMQNKFWQGTYVFCNTGVISRSVLPYVAAHQAGYIKQRMHPSHLQNQY